MCVSLSVTRGHSVQPLQITLASCFTFSSDRPIDSFITRLGDCIIIACYDIILAIDAGKYVALTGSNYGVHVVIRSR